MIAIDVNCFVIDPSRNGHPETLRDDRRALPG